MFFCRSSYPFAFFTGDQQGLRFAAFGVVGAPQRNSLNWYGRFYASLWRAELKEQLVPAEEGLYRLRERMRLPGIRSAESPRFLVTGEISSIYKRDGKTRKVHNLILLPDLEAADELSAKLEAIGNIRSDGRPILGVDSRDLLELILETCPDAELIPAHIWTPHFSMFGAFSGFDTIEACFADMTPHIHAAETGLSSDPPMNWRVSALDRLTLISNSDAHSPAKLGREANLMDAEFTYSGIVNAIRTGNGFLGTIEFFPEEGKYHLDGHRRLRSVFYTDRNGSAGRHLPRLRKKTYDRGCTSCRGIGRSAGRLSARSSKTV